MSSFAIREEFRLGNDFKYSKKKKIIIRKSKAGHRDTYSSFPADFCREILLKIDN